MPIRAPPKLPMPSGEARRQQGGLISTQSSPIPEENSVEESVRTGQTEDIQSPPPPPPSDASVNDDAVQSSQEIDVGDAESLPSTQPASIAE